MSCRDASVSTWEHTINVGAYGPAAGSPVSRVGAEIDAILCLRYFPIPDQPIQPMENQSSAHQLQ